MQHNNIINVCKQHNNIINVFQTLQQLKADISTKLAESDMSLEEYLNKLKISKHIMNYYKDFFNCKP